MFLSDQERRISRIPLPVDAEKRRKCNETKYQFEWEAGIAFQSSGFQSHCDFSSKISQCNQWLHTAEGRRNKAQVDKMEEDKDVLSKTKRELVKMKQSYEEAKGE